MVRSSKATPNEEGARENTGDRSSILSALGRLFLADRAPKIERLVSFFRMPIFWLTLASVVSFLMGVTLSPEGFAVGGVLAGVVLLGIVWPWLSLIGLRAEATFGSSRCHEFESFPVKLRIRSRIPIPVWGVVINVRALGGRSSSLDNDALVPKSNPDLVTRHNHEAVQDEILHSIGLTSIPPLKSSSFELRLTPRKRGEFPVGTVTLKSSFPFGLWTFRRRVKVTNQMLVWPAKRKSRHQVQGLCAPSLVSEVLSNRPGSDGEILGAREYRHGDSLKQIHWGHTARRDALTTIERQTSRYFKVRIFLDSTVEKPLEPKLDECCRLAAGLAARLHCEECELECAIDGKTRQIRCRSELHRFFDDLARTKGTTDMTSQSEASLRKTKFGPGTQVNAFLVHLSVHSQSEVDEVVSTDSVLKISVGRIETDLSQATDYQKPARKRALAQQEVDLVTSQVNGSTGLVSEVQP